MMGEQQVEILQWLPPTSSQHLRSMVHTFDLFNTPSCFMSDAVMQPSKTPYLHMLLLLFSISIECSRHAFGYKTPGDERSTVQKQPLYHHGPYDANHYGFTFKCLTVKQLADTSYLVPSNEIHKLSNCHQKYLRYKTQEKSIYHKKKHLNIYVYNTHISNHPTKKSSYHKKRKFLNPTSYPVATKVRRGNRFLFKNKILRFQTLNDP